MFFALLGTVLSCSKDSSVTPDNSITSIALKKGNVTTITLPITSSPGSTGISWYITTNPNEKVAKIDSGQIAENVKPSSIWGTHIWKITGIAKGTTKIKLALGRPTVPSEVYGQQTLDITVTE